MLLKRIYLRNYRTYEDELDLEIPPGLVGIYGSNGAGKCLPGPTRVWDAESGEGISIERFVRERRKWMLGFSQGRVRKVQVTDWHDLGPKPTVVVRLASGAEIEAASTHPLLTDRGCVTAASLRTGDWVAEARSLPAVGPALVTNDEALLLGLLLGDGCVTRTVSFSAADEDVVEVFRRAVERTFPNCTIRSVGTQKGRLWNHLVVSALSRPELIQRRADLARRLLALGVPIEAYVGSANVGRFLRGASGPSWETLASIGDDFGLDLWEDQCALHGGRAMTEWVRSFGLIGHDAHSKRIPESLVLLPDEQAAHLLAGLWLTDGYMGVPTHPRTSLEVSFTTASAGLASDVRALLLRLGMTSTRGTKRIAGAAYETVRVSAASYRRMAQMPLVGRKAARILAIVEDRSVVTSRPMVDLIPPSYCAELPTRSRTGRQRSRIQLQTHAMSREIFLDFEGEPEMAEAETLWSRVVSVTPTGREVPCFDVTVDTPEHLYLADTFIVHNSYLVESVLFALWGRTRTTIGDVRTTGVGGDCVAEVQFEHEGHLYTVRRTITGINSAVRASAFADGQQMAEGVRDTARYVHSILGMDDGAFRSSVFAEQKQLAAFSNQRPQQRKDLVLKLLGVMPLDTARDDARKDAKTARDRLEHLTMVLPSLEELRNTSDDAAAAADAAEAEAATEDAVAATARDRVVAAQVRLDEMEDLRRRYDAVVAEGKTAKAAHDGAARRVEELAGELAGLAEARATLEALAPAAAGLGESEAELAALQAVAGAAAAVARIAVPEVAGPPDEVACEAARVEAEDVANRLAALDGELLAARAELERARRAASSSAALSGEADCPMCGQALGDAFGQVQEHRAAEVAASGDRVAALDRRRAELAPAVDSARASARALAAGLAGAREAWAQAEQARARRAAAEAALAEAEAALGRPFQPGEVEELAATVAERRAAAKEAARLQAHLERAPALAAQHDAETARLAGFAASLEGLRAEAKALGFRPEVHAEARTERDSLASAAEAAAKLAHDARVESGKARVTADAAARRLADAEAQHATLVALVEESRHLGRLADLLNAFRNGVVGTVGPRLAVHAAELFAELTDREYDQLELDPDTYEIQIRDQGRPHGMQRFSGSETDLANLAVRVAISEHVRLLSGGTVGLLVLDEVFGPLDEDRKARMLAALERLRGRFRQVLVVTHDETIKAELPNAIEVVKLPGRRATARLLNA